AEILADFYGPAYYGTIAGISGLLIGVAQAASPLLAGLIHDWAGGYTAVMWMFCAAAGLAIIAATIAQRRAPGRPTVVKPAPQSLARSRPRSRLRGGGSEHGVYASKIAAEQTTG